MMRLYLLAIFPAVISVACAASNSPFPGTGGAGGAGSVDAGSDAAATDGPPDPVFVDASGNGGPSNCTRTLTVGALSISNPACFVNEHVSNQKTDLLFPCAGGAATAMFGTHMFTGTVSGDVIMLSDVEPFVFNNCDWQSTETIQGDLSKGTLTYTYSEKPVVSCPDLPCTASGDLAVSAGDVMMVPK